MTTKASRARARGPRWPWATPETIAALCALLEDGVPVSTACAKLRIPRDSLRIAREQDESVGGPIAAALAAFEETAVATILGAAEEVDLGEGKISRGDWKAIAWLLERRFPKKYAPPPKRLETTGKDGGAMQHEISVRIEDAIEGARPTSASIADAGGPRLAATNERDDES